jgi:hypothetical protein
MVDTEWAEIDGRAECVGITLRSYAKISDDGRALPVRGSLHPLRADVLRGLSMSIIDEHRTSWERVLEQPDIDERWPHADELRTTFTAKGRGRFVGADGRPLPTQEALAEVARVYQAAWRDGKNPTVAVADRFTLSRSAAAKRVARARAAGLLPKTNQGRPKGGRIATRRTK